MSNANKTIDVAKDDRYMAFEHISQVRNGKYRQVRWSGCSDWMDMPEVVSKCMVDVAPQNAMAAFAVMGYTITEPKPEPATLAWPTHCVRGVESGLIAYWGDLDACRREKCDGDQVHPMPRQPLSAEMRELLLALRSGEARRTGDAIDALLKGGVL